MYFQEIFNKQQELMNTYQEIEKKLLGDKCGHGAIDLNDRGYQAKLRQVAWFVMEELGEAYEAYDMMGEEMHKEEVIDTLHFATELCILSVITPEDIFKGNSEEAYIKLLHAYVLSHNMGPWSVPRVGVHGTQSFYLGTFRYLTKAINFLKNKPWKQTQKVTNEAEYKRFVIAFFDQLVCLMISFNWGAGEIHHNYMKKHLVNKQRQERKY